MTEFHDRTLQRVEKLRKQIRDHCQNAKTMLSAVQGAAYPEHVFDGDALDKEIDAIEGKILTITERIGVSSVDTEVTA